MTVELKRSAPIEFSYVNAQGEKTTFTVPACTVGGYREALRLEAEQGSADTLVRSGSDKLLNQAVALCGEAARPHLEALEVEMIQEVIQAQVALYSGLNPEGVVEVMRASKKKALIEALPASSSPASMA